MMNRDCSTGFLQLAEAHTNAIADVQVLRQRDLNHGSDTKHNALAQAVGMEEDLRAALIHWKPNSIIEAQAKFLYMAQYLFSTRTSLAPQEMAAMMNSIADLRKEGRHHAQQAQKR